MKNSKKFYKRKDLSQNTGNDKKYGVMILGLMFLCAIMIGLVANRIHDGFDYKAMADKSDDNGKMIVVAEESKESDDSASAVENSDTKADDKKLENVPEPSKSSYDITAAEVELIKEAINSDSKEFMLLVNKSHVLAGLYGSDNLVVPNVKLQKGRDTDESKVRKDMAPDLEKMFSDAEEAGVDLYLNSGYRSYDTQKIVYENELSQNGGEDTGYVAKPGTSEHQTGLAADITSSEVNMNLSEEFKDSKSGQWLFDNAYKYGFILRYDKSKEAVTGYKYEPWHYRYIGNKEISKLCHDKNLTLEDLYNIIK